MSQAEQRILTDDQRRSRILAIARTFWSEYQDVSLEALGTFFDEHPPQLTLDQRAITWDEVVQVIHDAFLPSPHHVPAPVEEQSLPLASLFLVASAARAPLFPGSSLVVIPLYDEDALFEAQGYLVCGLSQQSSQLIGYAQTIHAIEGLLAARHLRIPADAWYPCADQDYAPVFRLPALAEKIAACRARAMTEGYAVFPGAVCL